MIGQEDRFNELALPTLLRAARNVYGSAIRAALAKIGCDDVPPNGSFVISAIARTGAPLSKIIEALGVSKQAAGQLVDTLVLRGYLSRAVDPDDRRRMMVALTVRGRAAAQVCRSAVKRLDTQLAKTVGPDHIVHTRVTLAALILANREIEYHEPGD